jgi:hypothetical protein
VRTTGDAGAAESMTFLASVSSAWAARRVNWGDGRVSRRLSFSGLSDTG